MGIVRAYETNTGDLIVKLFMPEEQSEETPEDCIRLGPGDIFEFPDGFDATSIKITETKVEPVTFSYYNFTKERAKVEDGKIITDKDGTNLFKRLRDGTWCVWLCGLGQWGWYHNSDEMEIAYQQGVKDTYENYVGGS